MPRPAPSWQACCRRRPGLKPEAAILMDSVRTVLDLRSRYGSGKTVLTDPSKYIDLTYYDAARQS